MRKLTIHKELFKTGQTGFVKSCTVVNTILQFHNLDWDLESRGEVIVMLPLQNIYLISRPMSGNGWDSPGFWILDFGSHAVDSSPGIGFWMFCQWNWDSEFQSLVGLLDFLSRIPNSKAKDSKFHSKNLQDSGFQKEKFRGFRNPHSPRCGETSIPPLPRPPSKNRWFLGNCPPTPLP